MVCDIKKVYERMFTYSFSMLFLFEKNGSIYKWNESARRELGYGPEDDPVSIETIFRRDFICEQDKVKHISRNISESVAYRKNHTCFPVRLYIEIGDMDGQYYGYCIAENVTRMMNAIKDARKAKDELHGAARVKEDLVSNVTHELRTPMNGIYGITNELMGTELSGEQREMLEIIQKCCQNMTNIINDLLDFARMRREGFSLTEEAFHFRSFIKQLADSNMPLIRKKGLFFRVNIAPDVPDWIIGDELRLGQILNNLLSNSVKFTSVGSIEVNVTKTMDLKENAVELFFMVIDTGIGIKPQHLDKLFLSFSQVDASITRKYGGTGLGLAISKQLIELMGGEAFVESEYGKGSAFSFTVHVRKTEKDKNDLQSCGGGLDETIPEGALEEPYLQKLPQEKALGTTDTGEQERLRNILDRLLLTIEMENWEQAEELAQSVKALAGGREASGELRKAALSLLLFIRKELREKALLQYQKVAHMAEEVERKTGGENAE